MKRLRPSFLGLGLCLLATGLTGCKSPEPPWFSDLDRAKSFETFAAKNAEAWHNGSSLKRRTAVLIQGIHMTPVETMGSTLAMDFVAEQSCTVWCGHAVAIATDGYFLTSAHCADSTILSLVYWDGQAAKVATPRIVARLSDSDKLMEFVLLHVDAVLPQAFEWATESEIQRGNQVIAVGSTSISWKAGSRGLVQLTCTAGHISSTRMSANNGILITGDLPARDGDSGGPLLTVGGNLIGIHVGTIASRMSTARSVAVRPDLSRLEHYIAQDRASHKSDSISPPPILTQHSETAGLTVKLF
jgi:S1-C subfamily serine protease